MTLPFACCIMTGNKSNVLKKYFYEMKGKWTYEKITCGYHCISNGSLNVNYGFCRVGHGGLSRNYGKTESK